MSDRYSHDKLAQEKGELSELSSVKYVGVPLFLLAVFLGFGVTYQVLRTPSMELGGGDSRTSGAKVIAAVSASANQADLRLVNGKRLYAATCQACHQANGMGLPPVFPPLDDSEWVLGDERRLSAILLHGVSGKITVKGSDYSGAMPAFKAQFNDEEIASIVTFVRSAWSNKAAPVDSAVVKDIREKTSALTAPWDGNEGLNNFKY